MNSRAKGVRGELAVAHMFKKYGYNAERGCQHDGLSGHADVVGVPDIWIECKWNEQLDVEKAMQQAERDSFAYYQRTHDRLLPVVIWKKNRQPWRVSMRVIDFLDLCGTLPYSSTIPQNGLVTMAWDEWIEIYMHFEQEVADGCEH